MNPLIILINGWSKAGKDTIADYLVDSYSFTKLALAQEAKAAAASKYNFSFELTQTQEGKDSLVPGTTHTVRELIIQEAEAARAHDPFVWATLVANQIKDSRRYVISDWRFIGELVGLQKALQNATIVPIQVRNPLQTVSSVADLTEYSLLGFPFYKVIHNGFDISTLYKDVDEKLVAFLPRHRV